MNGIGAADPFFRWRKQRDPNFSIWGKGAVRFFDKVNDYFVPKFLTEVTAEAVRDTEIESGSKCQVPF